MSVTPKLNLQSEGQLQVFSNVVVQYSQAPEESSQEEMPTAAAAPLHRSDTASARFMADAVAAQHRILAEINRASSENDSQPLSDRDYDGDISENEGL